MISNLVKKFLSGHQRSVKAKKHILSSFLLKGVSILISLLLIPLSIDYLSPTKYGVWLVLMSIVSWLGFFDVGLGNGLRNKFATAKAEGRDDLAKIYVSTTYAIVSIIGLGVFFIFLIVNHFVSWNKILNTAIDPLELERLVVIVFGVFCMQFIVKLINMIFIADQQPAMSSAINTLGSLISLIVVFILIKTTHGSLIYLGASFSIITLVVPLFASLYFFNTSYKKYKPTWSSVDFSYAKDLMSIGISFFIMQGAALIIYMTDNIIITQVSGPEEVTTYNVVYKYFGIITMVFTIITSSLWSAFTEAFAKKEMDWMRNSIRKVMLLWLGFICIGIIMLLISNYIYYLWVPELPEVPFSLSLMMTIYVLLVTSIMVFGNFLSGVGKVRLSTYHSIFVGIINIPLSIFFAKNLGMGSTGVILATCVGVVISILFQPIQCWKIINGQAKGIWNK